MRNFSIEFTVHSHDPGHIIGAAVRDIYANTCLVMSIDEVLNLIKTSNCVNVDSFNMIPAAAKTGLPLIRPIMKDEFPLVLSLSYEDADRRFPTSSRIREFVANNVDPFTYFK